MKVTNWRRKLMASLVAGGVMTPAAASALNLDTNLIANPGFESVDSGILGVYDAPKILNWSGTNAFAYSHNPGVTGFPTMPMDRIRPAPATGISRPTTIQVRPPATSAHPTRSIKISMFRRAPPVPRSRLGEAAYKLSAFMSSYLNDSDAGDVQLDFKNSGGTIIGSAMITDSDVVLIMSGL